MPDNTSNETESNSKDSMPTLKIPEHIQDRLPYIQAAMQMLATQETLEENPTVPGMAVEMHRSWIVQLIAVGIQQMPESEAYGYAENIRAICEDAEAQARAQVSGKQ